MGMGMSLKERKGNGNEFKGKEIIYTGCFGCIQIVDTRRKILDSLQNGNRLGLLWVNLLNAITVISSSLVQYMQKE